MNHIRFARTAAMSVVVCAAATTAVSADDGASWAVDGGTLFVANTDPARIELYDARHPGAPIGTITKGLVDPYNVVVDADGTLYVQNGNNTIVEYARGRRSPTTTLSASTPSGTGVYVAVGPDGSVYSTNRGNDEIYVYAGGGTILTNILGLPSPDQPASIAVSAKNDRYVEYSRSTTPGATGIWEFPKGDSTGHDLGLTIAYDAGIAIDPKGNLLAGDAGARAIDVYKPGSKKPFRIISTAPYIPYQFALDRAGKRLFVVGGRPTDVEVYEYATGKAIDSIASGLGGAGYTLGVALTPAAGR